MLCVLPTKIFTARCTDDVVLASLAWEVNEPFMEGT